MKYSFLENNNMNNNLKINKKHLFEYNQFADDDEYDEEVDDSDSEVDKLLSYVLKDIDELIDILLDKSISLDEKELYIKHNKNLLDKQDEFGNTALMIACLKNSLKIVDLKVVELLLEYGNDVNKKDNYGCTALMKACEYRNLKIVKLLLEHGADVNKKDKYGFTALNKTRRGDIESILLSHRAKF